MVNDIQHLVDVVKISYVQIIANKRKIVFLNSYFEGPKWAYEQKRSIHLDLPNCNPNTQ